MSSLQYNEVYSRLYTLVSMYDFLDLTDLQMNEFMCNWLHSAVSASHVRRLFSSIKLDDEIQTIEFEMKVPIDTKDDSSDLDYVILILAQGMAINWLSPKVASMETISQTYGTTEMKYYSESSHLKEIKSLLNDMKSAQKAELADHSATWNSYLGSV